MLHRNIVAWVCAIYVFVALMFGNVSLTIVIFDRPQNPGEVLLYIALQIIMMPFSFLAAHAVWKSAHKDRG